jgi:hypothetical protein
MRQNAIGFLEIPLELVRVQSDARPILGEVVSQLVSLGHHPLDDALLPRNAPGDQEECRPGAVVLQLGKESWGGPGIRPIVQCQGYQTRASANLVETPGKTLGHAVEEPGEQPESRTLSPASAGSTSNIT